MRVTIAIPALSALVLPTPADARAAIAQMNGAAQCCRVRGNMIQFTAPVRAHFEGDGPAQAPRRVVPFGRHPVVADFIPALGRSDAVRTPRRVGGRLIAIALAIFLFNSCASQRATVGAWFSGHKTQFAATGSFLASKATSIALQTVISAAQSQADASKKADWLDSLSTGLRSSAVSSVSADDIRAIGAIWTPDKPHWTDLATQLAQIYTQTAGLPDAQRIEAIAEGLQAAAAAARKEPQISQIRKAGKREGDFFLFSSFPDSSVFFAA